MKRNFFIIFAINIFATFSYAYEVGKVFMVQGKVDVMHAGKAELAKTNMAIFEGDRIETHADSRVKIVMNDRNLLVVIENTKLTIKQYKNTKDSKQVMMNLEEGGALHQVRQSYSGKEDFYKVQTPRMVAGVRGTKFITEYDISNGDTVLCALENTVSMNVVENGEIQKKSVDVTAGNFVRLKKDQKEPNIIQTKPEWLKRVMKSYKF